jgi:hypothetical protein
MARESRGNAGHYRLWWTCGAGPAALQLDITDRVGVFPRTI